MVRFRGVTYEDGAAKAERNDCTVRAIAEACAMPYSEAHAMLAAAGRKRGNRFSFGNFISERQGQPINGRTVQSVHMPWHLPTLAQFVRDFPRGTFVVRKNGHVFCIRDGVVYDDTPQGARVRIKRVWHIA